MSGCMIQWSQIRQAIARKRSQIYLISCMQNFLNEPLGVLIAVENRTRIAALTADLLFLGGIVIACAYSFVLYVSLRCIWLQKDYFCTWSWQTGLTNQIDPSSRRVKKLTRKKIHIFNDICFFSRCANCTEYMHSLQF